MSDPMIKYLLGKRAEDSFFESTLSDSAVSTAVSCIALETADSKKYCTEIRQAKNWLLSHQDKDGLYGDSPESPANLTASFMAYAALVKEPSSTNAVEAVGRYLRDFFGDLSFASVKKGFLGKYGKDLTFSVPLLAMAAVSGFFPEEEDPWNQMPRFPFEVVLLPERFFRFLNLPVVSYAIPALICIGLAQHRHSRSGLLKKIRSRWIRRALHVLTEKQPESGGFLEAAPLTAFCALCLCNAGFADHPATQKALAFLQETQRDNGAWPIDHDLRQWTTALVLPVLVDFLSDSEKSDYRRLLKEQQTVSTDPFTRSAPGGWGWTTRSGSVPDADDTSAVLIALHALGEGASVEVCNGILWLLGLQNRDGGIPTFCRGWGKLPFDCSCPDISAHAYKAFSLYKNNLPRSLKKKVETAQKRILKYLQRAQRRDGSFVPLWFGDQRDENKEAPVYGTAVVLEHLSGAPVSDLIGRGRQFLLEHQHLTGGWGSQNGDTDYLLFSARCIRALSPYKEAESAVRRGLEFLRPYREHPETILPEPVGLYFAQLWYSEKLYAPVFLASCVHAKLM